MTRIALIGGTGSMALVPAEARIESLETTRWGAPSADLRVWRHGAVEVLYLPRHGAAEAIAPHDVNYRANIEALRDRRPDAVIGINAVGGITAAARPGRIVLPHQLIDYTSGREHTFSAGTGVPVLHVEFEPPFSEPLRARLGAAARAADLDALEAATYGVTQGPRLETAAEIDRLAADGCDVVGMTAMPEAVLAREADLDYAICAVVVNRAAGRMAQGDSIHAEVRAFIDEGMARVGRLIDAFLAPG